MTPALRWPAGLDVDRFLARHWQREPLLLRGALSDFPFALSPEELAGLACETEVESRLVLEQAGARPWEVRHGPFDEADFAALPESRWTLLVQDMDKHLPEVATLLHAFRFLPTWRVDDVMVSYAADGGSVGPHLDEYDVFLVQAAGRRHWQIDPTPTDTSWIPDLDLRILARFEPRESYLLEPGDALYLPPGVPHWGVAEGACMTWSVGFRAPAWRELAGAWCDFAGERLLPPGRYADPGLSRPHDRGEIRPEVFAEVRRRLAAALADAPEIVFREWLGRHLSEPKEHLALDPAPTALGPDSLARHLARGARLVRHPYSRFAWCRGDEQDDLLFASGEAYSLPTRHRPFLAHLTEATHLDAAVLARWTGEPDCLALLCELHGSGHYELDP